MNQPFFLEGASMRKNNKRVPSALKHGIYSGLELLPTESPARFRKFKKQIFAELNLVGRLEEDIGEEIVRLEWRRQNLFTYDLAERARARRSAIHSKWVPPVRIQGSWTLSHIQKTPALKNSRLRASVRTSRLEPN